MIDAELATEYVSRACENLLDAEDQVNQLIHEAGDASVLTDWKHWNPDEIPSMLDVAPARQMEKRQGDRRGAEGVERQALRGA